MSNLENSRPQDLHSAGVEIGHDLANHDWQGASAALSRYANDLSAVEFRTLVLAADRANNDSTITIEPVFAISDFPALDPVTGIATKERAKEFIGAEVGLNVPGSNEKPVLVTSPRELGKQVLEFGDIYDKLGNPARKP